MLLKTIAFLLLLYVLIKVIGRLFLPSHSSSSQRSGNARVFYHIFKNIREQQKNQSQRNQQKNSSSSTRSGRFEEIEEAEYEEIVESEDSESDSSRQ